jgi:Leucine-rich repeat (LRR) protein
LQIASILRNNKIKKLTSEAKQVNNTICFLVLVAFLFFPLHAQASTAPSLLATDDKSEPLEVPILKPWRLLPLIIDPPLGEETYIAKQKRPLMLNNEVVLPIEYKQTHSNWREIKSKKWDGKNPPTNCDENYLRPYYCENPSLGNKTIILANDNEQMAFFYDLSREIKSLSSQFNHVSLLLAVYSLGQSLHEAYLIQCNKGEKVSWGKYLTSFVTGWGDWFRANYSPEKVREVVEEKYPPTIPSKLLERGQFDLNNPAQRAMFVLVKGRILSILMERIVAEPDDAPLQTITKIMDWILQAYARPKYFPHVQEAKFSDGYNVLPQAVEVKSSTRITKEYQEEVERSEDPHVSAQPDFSWNLDNFVPIVILRKPFDPFFVNYERSQLYGAFAAWGNLMFQVHTEMGPWHVVHGTYTCRHIKADGQWQDYSAIIDEELMRTSSQMGQALLFPSILKFSKLERTQEIFKALAEYNRFYDGYKLALIDLNKLVKDLKQQGILHYFQYVPTVPIPAEVNKLSFEGLDLPPTDRDMMPPHTYKNPKLKREPHFMDGYEEVDLSDNGLRGYLGQDIKAGEPIPDDRLYEFYVDPQKCTILNLARNQFRNLKSLRGLVNIQKLNLSQNKFTRECIIPTDWTNLKSLDLSRNKITTIQFNESLPKLVELNVNDNQLSGDLTPFNFLTSLEQLHILRNLYTPEGLKMELEIMQKLRANLTIFWEEKPAELAQAVDLAQAVAPTPSVEIGAF